MQRLILLQFLSQFLFFTNVPLLALSELLLVSLPLRIKQLFLERRCLFHHLQLLPQQIVWKYKALNLIEKLLCLLWSDLFLNFYEHYAFSMDFWVFVGRNRISQNSLNCIHLAVWGTLTLYLRHFIGWLSLFFSWRAFSMNCCLYMHIFSFLWR